MKAIQSLWTQTGAFKLTREAAIMMSAAAAYMIRAYPDNELVTDIKGLRIADRLGWRYSAFSVALERFCPENQKHIWALGKIEATAIQTRPFFHLDLDFMIYERFTPRIENARIAVQSKDEPEFYQTGEAQTIMQIGGVPGWTVGFNAALTLWNDLELRDEYVHRSRRCAEIIAPHSCNGTLLSIVSEQGVLGQVLRERAIRPEACIPMASIAQPGMIEDGGDFDQKFTHLWGRCKKRASIIARVEARFAADFPEEYADFVRGWGHYEKHGLGNPFSCPCYHY